MVDKSVGYYLQNRFHGIYSGERCVYCVKKFVLVCLRGTICVIKECKLDRVQKNDQENKPFEFPTIIFIWNCLTYFRQSICINV
jgi:hypothetical protein